MAKFKDPKQRERHMRIFRKKLSTYDKAHLKKLLDKTWDSWTWDTGSELDEEKIRLLKQELEARQAWEDDYDIRWAKLVTERKNQDRKSQRKQRKKYREWKNRVDQAYERSMKKYGRKSNT